MARSRLRTKSSVGAEFGSIGSQAVSKFRQAAAAPHPPAHSTAGPAAGGMHYVPGRFAMPVGVVTPMAATVAASQGLQTPTPVSVPLPPPGVSPPPPDAGGGGGGGDQAPAPPPPDDGSEQPQETAPAPSDDGGYTEGPPPEEGYTEGPPPEEGYGEAPPLEEGADPGITNADYYGDPPAEVYQPPPFPLVNSHIRNGHLRTMAILQTPNGVHPMTTCVPVMGYEVSDGYVHFGLDTQHPGVDGAIMTSRARLLEQAEHEKIRMECESLVRRSRQGDQNATAVLAGMAENAKKGDPRARFAYSCARAYIKSNPSHADIGTEPGGQKLTYWTVVTLANGAPLTKARIESLAGSFPRTEDVEVFLHGLIYFREKTKLSTLQKSLDEYKRKILDLGRTIGEARALQMARRPGIPLRFFDKAVAWEFGE